MAHEIYNGEMAYVGAKPWHGLGKKVPAGASADQMLRAAKLDWQVVKVPTYAIHKNRPIDTQQVAIVREDTGQCFGVAGQRYTPVQNRETVRFFERFCMAGDLALETVGAIRGGEYVWALAKVNAEQIEIRKDAVKTYLLIANSHKPGSSLIIKTTMIRVVCNNTLTASFNESGHVFGNFKHDSDIHLQMEVAKFFVQAALDAQRKFSEDMWRLINAPIDASRAEELVVKVFDIKPDGEKCRHILHLFNGGQIGAELSTVQGTAWGLLNAVTEHIDYAAGKTQDTRMKSAWFGEGDRVKRKILEELLQITN